MNYFKSSIYSYSRDGCKSLLGSCGQPLENPRTETMLSQQVLTKNEFHTFQIK